MQTLTIDILNKEAIKLIKDMELRDMIRVHRITDHAGKTQNRIAKFKGTMRKQKLNEVEDQLNELRNSWE